MNNFFDSCSKIIQREYEIDMDIFVKKKTISLTWIFVKISFFGSNFCTPTLIHYVLSKSYIIANFLV